MRRIVFCSLAASFLVVGCSTRNNSPGPDVDPIQASAGPSEPALASEVKWQFERDDAGRVIKTIDPAGRTTKLHYELHDNKRVRKLVKELADGSRVTFEF